MLANDARCAEAASQAEYAGSIPVIGSIHAGQQRIVISQLARVGGPVITRGT